RLGGGGPPGRYPVDALNDQPAEVRVAKRVILFGAEVTMAQNGVEHAALAEVSGPGDGPGNALILDRRQRLDVGHHLHLIVQLIGEIEILQALRDRAARIGDLDGVGSLAWLAVREP